MFKPDSLALGLVFLVEVHFPDALLVFGISTGVFFSPLGP
jgi:hypothetical protein